MKLLDEVAREKAVETVFIRYTDRAERMVFAV